jgi:hypothetical protein
MFFIHYIIRQNSQDPKFKVTKKRPNQRRIKMVKLKNSNIMHINPSYLQIKNYRKEIEDEKAK